MKTASCAWIGPAKQANNAGTQIGPARIEGDAAVMLLVAHVYREETNGEEIIRIISAREAEKNDIRRYQEQAVE